MIGSVRRNLQPSLPELIVGRVQPLDVSGLTLGAIATVFTIGYVANMLGGDEAVNRHLPRRRMPLRLCVNENSVIALAEHGIECLRQIIADEQTAWVPSGASEVPSGDCWRYPPPPPRPAEPAKSRNPLHLLERPGSPLGRNPMESDEEQVANLTTRSGEALLKCHRSDLIHRPGDGTLLRAKGVSNRPNLQSPLVSGCGRSRRGSSSCRPACGADNGKLAGERDLALAHAGASRQAHPPALQGRALHRPGQDDVSRLVEGPCARRRLRSLKCDR